MDNEFSLLNLRPYLLRKHIGIFVGVLIAFLCGGALYLTFATPVYEANVNLLRPSSAETSKAPVVSDMALASDLRSPLISPTTLFNRAAGMLSEPEFLNSVFVSINSAHGDARTGDLNVFLDRMSLSRSKATGQRTAALSYRHPDGKFAAMVINILIDQANLETSREVNEELHYALLNRVELLRQQIEGGNAIGQSTEAEGGANDFLGDKMIELKLEHNTLKNLLNRPPQIVQCLSLDSGITLSDEPVSPNKALILALCAFAGTVVGFMLTLTIAASAYRRANASQSS